jgi:hypothetical protein
MNISDFLDAINSMTTTKFKISKNPGIETKQLKEVENTLGIKLPNDLVEFYTSSNGVEGDDYIFNIVPFEKTEKDIDEMGTYLVFSEYMIYSETCGLEIDKIDPNKYKFFNTSTYPIENGVTRRNYLADSLVDFIKLYSIKGTFGIWGDEYQDEENTNNETLYVKESTRTSESKITNYKKPWWKFW